MDALDRFEGATVAALLVENGVVASERLLEVAERVAKQRAPTEVELELLVRVLRYFDTTTQDLDEVVVHRCVEVEAIEGGERVGVLRLDLEHAEVRVHRVRGVMHLELVDARKTEERHATHFLVL